MPLKKIKHNSQQVFGLMNSNRQIVNSYHYDYQIRLKRLLSILFFLCLSLTFNAQLKDTTFFDIKRLMDDELNRFFAIQLKDSVTYKKSNYDTIVDKETIKANHLADDHYLKRFKLIRQLKGKDFPDIYFETYNGEAKALSDYKVDLTFLIFNYAYCQSCLDATDVLLDSINDISKTTKIQIITLLSDSKNDGDNFYEKYHTKVELGFITKEREQDHLIGVGTPYMYVLDRNRRIIGSMYLNDIKNSNKFKSRILDALDKN